MLLYHLFLKARGAHVPAQLRPDMSPVYKGPEFCCIFLAHGQDAGLFLA